MYPGTCILGDIKLGKTFWWYLIVTSEQGKSYEIPIVLGNINREPSNVMETLKNSAAAKTWSFKCSGLEPLDSKWEEPWSTERVSCTCTCYTYRVILTAKSSYLSYPSSYSGAGAHLPQQQLQHAQQQQQKQHPVIKHRKPNSICIKQ